MKLRLPRKFQAALMAVITTVSFTTVSSASLGAAAILLSTQHAAAQDDAYNSLELNYNASAIEELSGVLQDLDEEKLAETTTAANEVAAGGVDDILSAMNEIGAQEVVSPMAAVENIQPAAGYSGVENNASFTDNSYSGTSSNGSEESAAPVAATYTPTLAQAPAASASLGASSGSNFSGLGVSTGDSAAGIGSASLGITGDGDSSILAAPALLGAAGSDGTSWPTVSFTGGTTYAAGTQVGNYTLASQMTTGNATAGKFTFTPAVNITGANFRAGDYTLSLWVDVASLNQGRVLFIYGSPNGVGNSLTANALQWDAAGSLTLGRGNMTDSYAGFSFDNSNKSTITNLTLPKSGLVNFTLVNTVGQDGKQNATLYLNGEAAGTFTAYNGNMNGGDGNTVMGTYLSSTPVYGNISLTNRAITSELALHDFIGFQTSALIWAGSPSNVWQDGNGAAWQDGTVFHNGDIVVFDNTATNKQVLVNSDISAGYMTVSDTYTFNVGNSGSLTAASLSVAGEGAAMSLTGSGTMTAKDIVLGAGNTITVTDGTTISLSSVSGGAGSSIQLQNGGSAEISGGSANALEYISGNGDVHIADTMLFAGSSNSQAPATTHATGALIVDPGKQLKIGTTNTGAYVHTYVNMESFNEVRLDNSSLWIHNDNFSLNNLTVTENNGTVTIHDSAGQNTNTLTLKGTTQLDGTLTFNGTWKQKFTIEQLNGDGTLKLSGTSYDKQIVNIGGGSVGTLTLGKSNVEANITGDLTVGTLTGSGLMNVADAAADVTINGTNGYTGAINVNSGTLDLTSTVGTGSLTVANGATLKLAGTGSANLLNVTGDLTLAPGSTLDLSRLASSFVEGQTVNLASYTGNATYDGVTITGLGDGRTATLSVGDNYLKATFAGSAGLVWAGDNTNHTWTNDSATPWNGGTFTTGADVTFNATATNKEVLVNSAITAGSMTVSDAYTFNVGSGGSLTADSLTGTDGSFKKTGSGTATVNGDVDMARVEVSAGTLDLHGADDGTSTLDMGNVALTGNNATLKIGSVASATAKSVELGDNIDTTIVLGSDMTVSADGGTGATDGAVYSISANRTATIKSADGGPAHTLTTEKFEISNVDSKVKLQNATLTVTGAATTNTVYPRNRNTGTMIVDNQGTLNLNGTTAWKNGNSYVNVQVNQGGTVNVNGAGSHVFNNVTLANGSTLDLSGTTTTVTMQDLTLGGTLKLSGAAENLLTVNSFTGSTGGILDLSELTFGQETSYTLLTSSTGTITALDSLTVTGVDDSRPYSLGVIDNALVLTFGQKLIWNGGTGDWSTDTDDKNWHTAGAPGTPLPFAQNDFVTFDSTLSTNAEADLTSAITSGSVTVESAANVVLNGADDSCTLTSGTMTVDGTLESNVDMTASSVTVGGTGSLTANGDLSTSGISIAQGGQVATGAGSEMNATTVTMAANSTLTANGAATMTTLQANGGTATFNGDTTIGRVLVNTGDVTIAGSGDISVTATAQDQGVEIGANKHLTLLTENLSVTTLHNNGTLTVGDGTHPALVKTQYFVNGNANNNGTSSFEIKSGATVASNGADQSTHKGGLVLSEWNNRTTGTVYGKLLAPNASIWGGDSKFVLNIEDGGLVAAKGVKTQKNNVAYETNVKDGGTLVLGGASTPGQSVLNVAAGGTIGTYNNAANYNGSIVLGENSGNKTALVDTTLYQFNADQTDISQGTAGGTLTLSGVISGEGGLTKVGSGTLKLSGANSYTGNTVVNEGTLLVSGADSLTSTSLVTVNGGGNLQFDAALGSSAQSSAITLAGGMLTFTGMNDNALNVDGVLTLGSGSILDVSNLNLTGMYGTVTLANTGGTISGDVSQVTVQGLAEGYSYQLLKKHDFATNTDSLILTYNNPSESLIWRGNYDDLWVAEEKATGEHTNWYSQSNVRKDLPFSDNDRVRFMNDQEVRLGSDVHSGTMTVDRGKSVTVDTNGFNFSLGEIEGTDAALTVKGSDDKTTEFRGVVTIKDLTLDGGTVVLDKYSNVTGQLTVQNGADMTANSYVVANTLNIDNSSVELKSAGSNIQTVSVTDSSLKVDGSSLFGDLTMNGGTLTNTGDLQLTSAEMQGTGTITGAGSISTGALNLGPGSNTTVNGGQTISITSGEGISPTVGGPLATLTLEDATITGTTAWALHTGLQVNLVSTTGTGTIFDTNGHIITVDSVLGGNGTLTKEGLGTLVLRGADYDYTGNTTVAGGTLRLDNTNALVNAASVSVEGDSSLWLNTGSNALTLGTASIANGATLRLAGENLLNIADGKSLTLNNGAIIDVSSVQFTPGEEKYYVLATGSVNCTDLNSIQLTFEHGEHPAPGSTTQLLYENGQLLLRYTLNEPKDLIWDGGEAVWDVGSTEHWHSAETPDVSTTFNTYDDVTFEFKPGQDSKANVTAVDIHATNMYIEAGTVNDENIVELNVGSGRQLDVDFIETEDNTQIKKTGSGTAYLGVDDETFSSDMIVNGGTLTAQFVDMADNGVNLKVTGDLTRSNGELNVIVGDGYHDTYATFEQGTTVQGVTNIETKEMANVEFKGNVSIVGSNPTITAGDGTTISFKGTTSVDSNSMTFAGQGNVYMGENTTFSQGGGRHTYLKDAVNVTIEKMSTSQDQTFLLYDGTSLTIKDVYLEKTNGEQVMYTGYQATGDDTERQFITIDTIHFNNSPNARLAVGAISSGTAGDDEQQTGDIYVNTLISGTTESGEIVPSTFVFATYAKPRNDYDPKGVGGRDYDVPEVLHLGGDNDSRFAGTILVCDHNVNSAQGIGYGGTENARKNTLVILNDNTVAANAVFDFDVVGEYSDYGLGINSDHVKILGIKGTELPGDDTFLIFSGNIGTALRAEYGSDNEVRTLELAGDGTYVSSGTVDKNLNLVKSGTGNQTFTGDTDRFDANIDIQDGVLAFTKANASLTVEDLTLGAHGSKTDTTLSVRNANGTVGTVELKGTLKAHGEGQNTGAALDANLTLGQDAVLDVHETLTRVDNPEQGEDHADYFGGLNMLSNSITLSGQSVLSETDLQNLEGLKWGDRYDLAFNVSSLSIGGETYTAPIGFDPADMENNIDASLYFSNLQAEDYYICYSGAGLDGPGGNVGVFYLYKAPEPTTSTLSLLALCALTARRRRKN